MKKNPDPLVAKFGHQGPLWLEHDFPPAPFNPDYDPKAKDRFHSVTSSMETDNFYATHTREECKAEWAKRYQTLKNVVAYVIIEPTPHPKENT